MDLIYGEVDDRLVFIPRSQALELARLTGGVDDIGTWGGLKAAMSPVRWQEIVGRVADGDEARMPAADRPFDPDEIPGRAESDWPEWPAQEMLNWMPADIVMRYGNEMESLTHGTFLSLDLGDEEEIVAALEYLDWTCEEDEALVAAASGFD